MSEPLWPRCNHMGQCRNQYRADEIDRLQAENKRLMDALIWIGNDPSRDSWILAEAARAAVSTETAPP